MKAALLALAFAGPAIAADPADAGACVAPAFAMQVLQAARGDDGQALDLNRTEAVEQTQAPIPGHEDICAYVAAWIELVEGGQRLAHLYFATYQKETGAKRADLHVKVDVENLGTWAPTPVIDPVRFDLRPDAASFAVRLTTLMGKMQTYNGVETDFRLIVDDGQAALKNVFTDIADIYEQKIDDDSQAARQEPLQAETLYIVDPAAHRGFHDLIKQVSLRARRTNGTLGPRTKTTRTRFQYDGQEYAEARPAH